MQPVPPSIVSVSFSCPHCGAHADQSWFDIYAKEIDEHGTPYRFDHGELATLKNNATRRNSPVDMEVLTRFTAIADRTERGDVFFRETSETLYNRADVANVAISRCYSCKQLTVWIGTRIVYPRVVLEGVVPNRDLPPDISQDYDEARSIVDRSPRGAAALLRLCIQKLCKHLGEPGESLNSDIASLVKKGLATRVQQALDIVRVIGNESVHPGQIDLRDDSNTALRLFDLVNLIAEKMITEPKHVGAMFNKLVLPEKRLGIEARDKPKTQ